MRHTDQAGMGQSLLRPSSISYRKKAKAQLRLPPPIFMATLAAYESSRARDYMKLGGTCSNPGSFNALCWAGDQTLASVATQAAAVGLSIQCTSAGTPQSPSFTTGARYLQLRLS